MSLIDPSMVFEAPPQLQVRQQGPTHESASRALDRGTRESNAPESFAHVMDESQESLEKMVTESGEGTLTATEAGAEELSNLTLDPEPLYPAMILKPLVDPSADTMGSLKSPAAEDLLQKISMDADPLKTSQKAISPGLDMSGSATKDAKPLVFADENLVNEKQILSDKKIAQGKAILLQDNADGLERDLTKIGADNKGDLERLLMDYQKSSLQGRMKLDSNSGIITPQHLSFSQNLTDVSSGILKPQLHLQTDINSTQWRDAFSDRILLMTQQQIKTASIQLNPPQLGPLEVKINMNHDQASVTFTSQFGNVRDAIDGAIPRLREMLDSQGIQLGDVNISNHSNDTAPQGEGSDETSHSGSTESGYEVDTEHLIQESASGHYLVDFYA